MQILAVRANGVVEPTDGSAGLWLAQTDNPAGGERTEIDQWLAGVSGPGRCIAWSGTVAADLFARDAMTWLAPGVDAFRLFCDGVEGRLNSTSRRLLFRPHCRHVLSDPSSCVSFVESRSGGPFGIALCPASLFETGMLASADDHLRRVFETLGPFCEALILADIAHAESDAGPDALPSPAPIGDGVLNRGLLRTLLEQHCRPDTPVIFPVGDAGEQASLLGLA